MLDINIIPPLTDRHGQALRASSGLLYLLGLANFAIGFGGFVVIGLLAPIAATYGIDAASSGLLISVYAALSAVGSPILVALTGAGRAIVRNGAILVLGPAGAVLVAMSARSILLVRNTAPISPPQNKETEGARP